MTHLGTVAGKRERRRERERETERERERERESGFRASDFGF